VRVPADLDVITIIGPIPHVRRRTVIGIMQVGLGAGQLQRRQ
jgi:hypothetical protein